MALPILQHSPLTLTHSFQAFPGFETAPETADISSLAEVLEGSMIHISHVPTSDSHVAAGQNKGDLG